MAHKTYKARVVVLRKIKLAEKDLIITMLDEAGELRRAVAKGARKPGGSYAAKTELFSVVDAVFAEGRNLDVITEARFANGHASSQLGMEQSACAAAVAELVSIVAQEGLTSPRLFAMTVAAFNAIAGADPAQALAITAADLWKTLSISGFRPSFDTCVVCGDNVFKESGATQATAQNASNGFAARMKLSVADGGVVCHACQAPADVQLVDENTLRWVLALLKCTFDEVLSQNMPLDVSFSVLQLARQWIQAHVGRRLKSLDFLFSTGLF